MKHRRQRLPLIIASIPFLIAGFDAFSQQNVFWGIANLGMAILNLLALKFIEEFTSITNLVLFTCNSGMAFIMSYQYYIDGAKGLPYAWIAAGIIYIVAGSILYGKSRATPQSTG